MRKRTLGMLAQENADKMSDDEKIALTKKHNEYKEVTQADKDRLAEASGGTMEYAEKPSDIVKRLPGTGNAKPRRKVKKRSS